MSPVAMSRKIGTSGTTPTTLTAHELAVGQSAAELNAALATHNRAGTETADHERVVREARLTATRQMAALAAERVTVETSRLTLLQRERELLTVRASVRGTVVFPATPGVEGVVGRTVHRRQVILSIDTNTDEDAGQ